MNLNILEIITALELAYSEGFVDGKMAGYDDPGGLTQAQAIKGSNVQYLINQIKKNIAEIVPVDD